MGHSGVYGPLGDVLCATRGYMSHSGGYGPIRGCIWATQGMYLGNSGDIYGPLRRVNGIVNGIVRDIE